MASCDIQVVNPAVLSRIESFLNDPTYREIIESSCNYNTRLSIERRLRLPFLDSQTGVAQNHSCLWMKSRERIPGLYDGQVYTYPSKRWRKKRRQYLMQSSAVLVREAASVAGPLEDLHTISTVENPAAGSTAPPSDDSKDSSAQKDDSSVKALSQDAWYYDEFELQAMEAGLDEDGGDSDYDYEESYSKRRKKRGAPGKPPRGSGVGSAGVHHDSPHAKKQTKGTGQGRGRKKGISYDASDTEKPFSCDLCGARYKTRPGLTYHYSHSHKEKSPASSAAGSAASVTTPNGGSGVGSSSSSQASSIGGVVGPSVGVPSSSGGLLSGGSIVSTGPSVQSDLSAVATVDHSEPPQSTSPAPHNPLPGWTKFQDTYLTYLNTPGDRNRPPMPGRQPTPNNQISQDDLPPMTGPSAEKKPSPEAQPIHSEEESGESKDRAQPSLYCDFCLGDQQANKKSGRPEPLVSCSDCGRSGHPSCLQFTDNMIISIRKYRWQCIECKCCSLCGTSDNDDQLLFCDDCDRGYHMYCLVPPLTTPPEGSWSCRLCLIEFHSK